MSLLQVPGRGEGTLWSGTGSQLADMSLCSLNEPMKASLISRNRNAHTAEPPIALGAVLNVAYRMASTLFSASSTLFSIGPCPY